jgi:hypothetical protein
MGIGDWAGQAVGGKIIQASQELAFPEPAQPGAGSGGGVRHRF